MAKRRNTFTIEEINRLRQLFMVKDMAGSGERSPFEIKCVIWDSIFQILEILWIRLTLSNFLQMVK